MKGAVDPAVVGNRACRACRPSLKCVPRPRLPLGIQPTSEAELSATRKDAAKELGSLMRLSSRLRAELGASPAAGADRTNSASDGLVRAQAQLEAMVASAWRSDHGMLLELEEVICVLDALDIRSGLHTSRNGVSVWICDRDYQHRMDGLLERDRNGAVPEGGAVARWLHEAALQLFPKYARLYEVEQRKAAKAADD
jgi:hypothetical protein